MFSAIKDMKNLEKATEMAGDTANDVIKIARYFSRDRDEYIKCAMIAPTVLDSIGWDLAILRDIELILL